MAWAAPVGSQGFAPFDRGEHVPSYKAPRGSAHSALDNMLCKLLAGVATFVTLLCITQATGTSPVGNSDPQARHSGQLIPVADDNILGLTAQFACIAYMVPN